MYKKRFARPYPPRKESRRIAGANEEYNDILRDLMTRRVELETELDLLDAEIDQVGILSLCGENDLQDVERYDGSLGVSRSFVDSHQSPIGNIQWVSDLSSRFNGPGDSPGNVAGQRWATGGLIDKDLFLSAGHNFDALEEGWRTPKRNSELVEPEELATLMNVKFNYQIDGDTGQLRDEASFPITELIEYRVGGVDYAIVRLGRGANGKLPGEEFSVLNVATDDISESGAMLCLIQHPQGAPKQIEAGEMKENNGGRITYEGLDTLDGSSGAPILAISGEVVGVHLNGGCTRFSGANKGAAIGLIRTVSQVI